MNKHLLFIPLAAVVFTGPRPGQAQDRGAERKVTIEVTTTENGQTTHVKRELDANDEQAVQDALREMGVLDQLAMGDEDGNVTIDIRRMMRDGAEATRTAMRMIPRTDRKEMERYGFLGVKSMEVATETSNMDPKNGTIGAQVTEVIAGSAAASIDLQEGDVITQIQDKAISGPRDLAAAIREEKPDAPVTLTYFRAGKKNKVNARLGERPSRSFDYAYGPEDLEYLFQERGDRAKAFHSDRASVAFLGVTPMSLDKEGQDMIVGGVEKGSSAEAMGIAVGDIIINVNGQAVHDFNTLRKIISEQTPGSDVTVVVAREGAPLNLTGTLGE